MIPASRCNDSEAHTQKSEKREERPCGTASYVQLSGSKIMKGISYGNGHRRRRLGYSTLALSIGLVCASQQAREQEEADGPSEGSLSDLVVTAQKSSKNHRKKP